MNGLLNAIRIDHRIMRPRYPILLALLAIGVFVGSMAGNPLITILLTTLISAPVGGSYFATFEANRLDHLYGTLPLKRSAAEAGSYAHTIGLVTVNGLLASLAAWCIGLVQHLDLPGGAVADVFALSFLGATVYIGLLFPVYLSVPFSKVYIFTNVPFYLVAVGILYVVKRTDWLTHLAPVTDFYETHPWWASVLTLAAGLALLAVSWSVAHATAAARRP